MTTCEHQHTREEYRDVHKVRYIPSGWETQNCETEECVTLRDVYTYCAECGELLDVLTGD